MPIKKAALVIASSILFLLISLSGLYYYLQRDYPSSYVPGASKMKAEQSIKIDQERPFVGDVYKSKKGEIAIRLPVGWDVYEPEGKTFFLSVQNTKLDEFELRYSYRSGLNITSTPFSGSLGSFLTSQENLITDKTKNGGGTVSELKKEDRNIGDNKVRVVDYKSSIVDDRSQKLTLHVLVAFILKDSIGYTFFAVTPEESWGRYADVIRNSLDSFQITLSPVKAESVVQDKVASDARVVLECNKLRDAVNPDYLKAYSKVESPDSVKARLRMFGFLDKSGNLLSMDAVVRNCIEKGGQ